MNLVQIKDAPTKSPDLLKYEQVAAKKTATEQKPLIPRPAPKPPVDPIGADQKQPAASSGAPLGAPAAARLPVAQPRLGTQGHVHVRDGQPLCRDGRPRRAC